MFLPQKIDVIYRMELLPPTHNACDNSFLTLLHRIHNIFWYQKLNHRMH